MSDQFAIWGLAAAAVATGLVAGVFLTFSDFVMRSLNAAQPAAGMEAMQLINRKVYRSVFMVLLLGMVPVSLGIGLYGTVAAGGAAAQWAIAGAISYVIGVFAVTAAGNVPMNKRLDVLGHGDAGARSYWETYGRIWTLWNHVRTVASFAATWCYLVAAIRVAQGA